MKKYRLFIFIVLILLVSIFLVVGCSNNKIEVVENISVIEETSEKVDFLWSNTDSPIYFKLSNFIKGIPFKPIVENNQSVEQDVQIMNENKFDFSSTLFIGDSIFVGLEKYLTETDNEDIKPAVFFANGGFAIRHNRQTVNESSTHPKLNGEKMKISKAVKTTDKDNLFIMMGTNDLVVNTPTTAKGDFSTLIGAILDVNPGMKIHIIETVVPVNGKNNEKLTCENAKEYNSLLKSYAEDKGYAYIELPEALFDENGCLKEEYSSDGFLHLNENAYKLIVDKLVYTE